MSLNLSQFIALDLPPLLTGLSSGLACALLGNFLLLRRMSLMGDALSHSVLPGIVFAFLISGTRASLPIFIGAAAAALLCAVTIEAVRRLGRVEGGAAMGVVFSLYFAGGILLMEQAAARNIDLDADCLLHGQLETIFWYPPDTLSQFFTWTTLTALPQELVTSVAVLLFVILFLSVFRKELKLVTFDQSLAAS
ncbi:MAG: metal ABC transporter permease, partial [Bdellovibrionales bacterium]|nr:metal ABC transporter permease [Bdellovibrionales bacterium]